MVTTPVPAARRTRVDVFGVYLNDHLAGATAGTGLARRMAASAEPGSERAALLQRLAKEIAADRAALVAMMDALGIGVRGYKVLAAWAGTQAGRLKLNGHLLTRSPLSDLEETEILRLGVTGKAAGWRTLRTLAETDPRLDAERLDELLRKASRQEDELEELRVQTARQLVDEQGADMPTVSRTFRVAPAPAAVIGYLTDFSRAEEWDPGTVSCTRIDPGPVAVGASWRNVSKVAGVKAELTYTLRRLTEDTLVFVGENKGATSTDTITVVPDGTGSEVTYRAVLKMHGTAVLFTPVMGLVFEKLAGDTERQLTSVLNALPAA